MELISQHYDKWLHFIIMGMPVIWMLILRRTKTHIYMAFGLCLLVALGKEFVFDLWLGYGNFEWLDAVFTMILPTIGLIISLIHINYEDRK